MSTFGCGEFNNKNPDKVTYYKCADEAALLRVFLEMWNSSDYSPDIVTGWNVEFFDIPYLVNRINKVLGESYAKRLSPWGYLTTTQIELRGQMNTVYTPVGITVLDYMQLYKKFAFKQQERYTLDHICSEELGEKKVDYGEYGNLAGLQRNNWQKYVEYNIRDVELVDMLDDKLKLIELVLSVAYDAKVNYSDAFATVRPWDVLIHNYLLDRNIAVPQAEFSGNDADSIMGGYVKEVQAGMHNWVVSLDLNSLYPHIIMQYNISPEMYRGKYPDEFTIDNLLEGYLDNPEHRKVLVDNNYATTANRCMFDQSKDGFLSTLMEKMYVDRTVYKKKMIECKKEYEALENKKSPEGVQLIKDIARYDNLQMAKKIQLNSGYGALANKYFRWYENDFAEAITSSGQLTTRWIENKLNLYLNKLLKTTDFDYVIACDTDSVYLTLDALVKKVYGTEQQDKKKIVEFLDGVCVQKLEPYIDKCYEELRVYMNAAKQKMKMKREAIADKGIWTAKKRYILNMYNLEGVAYDKPKLKMMGIEAIRTSTPSVVRDAIKQALTVIMNETEESLQNYVCDFRNQFENMPFDQVAFPRGVKELEKWADNSSVYKKGTPIAVKGALIYNHALRQRKLETKYETIESGNKIKFSYLLTPNPLQCSVISAAGDIPVEFNLEKYVDKGMQFEKSFLEPMNTIVSAIGWECEKRSSLDSFFG
jgi:DNA polymerase elongation subunit (family B)